MNELKKMIIFAFEEVKEGLVGGEEDLEYIVKKALEKNVGKLL